MVADDPHNRCRARLPDCDAHAAYALVTETETIDVSCDDHLRVVEA